jgi:predicted dehydrogenase
VEQVLEDKTIEIIANLTTPSVHAPLTLRALAAGKHVWSEKPLALTRDAGQQIVEAAQAAGLRVGCAPDTILGAAQQTARRAIAEGAVGRILALTAFMLCRGHERWHPDPEFYYRPGGGPLFDMGPYYLTAILHLAGPIQSVQGTAATLIPQRTIATGPKKGQVIESEVPDHVAGLMTFQSGTIGTIVTSFACMKADLPHLIVFGTEGTMTLPAPYEFDGPVRLRRDDDPSWKEVPQLHCAGYHRGAGLAELACALRSNRPHRASAEQAFAVLDLMQGFLDSSRECRAYEVAWTWAPPAPLSLGLPFLRFDE